MKDVTTDLYDRIALLHLRHSTVFGMKPPANPDYGELASLMEVGLRTNYSQAVEWMRALIDPADLSRAEFWTTSLGRLLFAAGGYGAGEIGQALAAGVLGCSRQYVHDLIVKGRLSRRDSLMVDAAEVRDLLKARIDALVK